MSCITHWEKINHFIDGELELREQTELFRHLTHCPDCQSFIDAAVRMKEACRLDQAPYPASLDEAIMERILPVSSSVRTSAPVKPERRIWNRHLVLPWPVAASFAAMTVVAGLLLGRLILPRSEPVQDFGGVRMSQTQPPTVILMYGMPPVDVVGTPVARTLEGPKQHINP